VSHASIDPLRPRTLGRDARRQQLINATIAMIAEKGFSRTTLTDVAARAGVSHGLVLFHFKSKDQLLTETLDHLAEEYRASWQAAFESADERPEEKILALIKADFSELICTPAKLAAWCAFWGESQSRPLYQSRCGANDAHYNMTLVGLCSEMNTRYGYAHDPQRTGRLLRIITEGVWLDLMTLEVPYSVEEAFQTAMQGIRAIYPRHFQAPVKLASPRKGTGGS
jgi:TetR/AcrR family transcriptional regulator, transcriptional repressor of bet genes